MAAPIVSSFLDALRTLPALLGAERTLNPLTLLLSPATTSALHVPLGLSLALIPTSFLLTHLSGNVGWVDRVYTTLPVVSSFSIAAWAVLNPNAADFGASLPRVWLLIALQALWSARLTWHTARRGLYSLDAEDYRYATLRKIVPKWAFEAIHIAAVAIPQPLLIFALSIPVAAALQPAAALSPGPGGFALPLSAVSFLVPGNRSAPGTTPVLHLVDGVLALAGLAIVALQAAGDNAMYRYQEAKHAHMRGEARLDDNGVPLPIEVPDGFWPGFPTTGLHALIRHPNFVAEQLFWLNQGIVALFASVHPPAQACLGPAFFLSLLFCASTRLTEWITTRKYPAYRAYQRLVGMFLPQETAIKWAWTTLRGTRAELQHELATPPAKPAAAAE
ncbi:hypothetical protein Q8F55_003992 [Vanrija albida]|uniref:Steroid 5-alpha reductase C-terminal domain-containing protein n=1 Tax=Vanrija albida TaxID=181172 RepID=A0ABR3Q5U0_9TREE